MVDELKLYKLLLTDKNVYEDVICDELGWINDEQFCVWIPYCYLQYFIENLCKIFGNCILMMVDLMPTYKKNRYVLTCAKR